MEQRSRAVAQRGQTPALFQRQKGARSKSLILMETIVSAINACALLTHCFHSGQTDTEPAFSVKKRMVFYPRFFLFVSDILVTYAKQKLKISCK